MTILRQSFVRHPHVHDDVQPLIPSPCAQPAATPSADTAVSLRSVLGRGIMDIDMRKLSCCLAVFVLASVLLPSAHGASPYRGALRLKDGKVVGTDAVLSDLKGVDMIFVGETHDDMSHHQAQHDIIAALHESGRDLAIGLEMFRTDAQPDLDRWTAGRLDQDSFMRLYYAHWRVPWPLYRDIFLYAREHNIPLIGLNISQTIAAKISQKGFASLSPAERKQLPPGISCSVDPKYMDFIRRAYRAHWPGDEKAFTHFCEAQMVWDKAMAWRIVQYKTRHSVQSIVVLAGSGHAWKPGIPAQVAEMGKYSIRVVLPGLPDMPGQHGIGVADADYILLR